jgi:hypothetical protein
MEGPARNPRAKKRRLLQLASKYSKYYASMIYEENL